jgi:hypothetical protein
MERIAYAVRCGLELLLRPFDQLPPALALPAVAVPSGIAIVWAIGRLSARRPLARARDRMSAAIYEVRLYADEPVRILAAQAALLRWSAVYLLHLLPALLLLAGPLALLLLHLETRFGLAPLPVGEPVLVRLEFVPGAQVLTAAPAALPSGLAVTAPVLVIEEERRAYVRVVATRPGSHALPLQVGGVAVRKQLVAAGGPAMPERRTGASLLWAPGVEPPLPAAAGLAAIRVVHPPARQRWLGLAMPWWLYWLLLATLTAVVARRPLRVPL